MPNIIFPTTTTDTTPTLEDRILLSITSNGGELGDTTLEEVKALMGVSAGVETMEFDITRTGDVSKGQIGWDEDKQTFVFGLDGESVALPDPFNVSNRTGSTIAKGTELAFDGPIGVSGKFKVVPYDSQTQDPIYKIGITLADIPNDADDGLATRFNVLRGVDTSAWTVGTILYSSKTTPGAFQSTKPATGDKTPSAVVLVQHAINGEIQYRYNKPTELLSNLDYDNTTSLLTATNPQDAIDELAEEKLDKNTQITGATKTKITYDADGLVTAGEDAGISDITGLQSALDGKLSSTFTKAQLNTAVTDNDVAFINGGNTFSGTQTFTGTVTLPAGQALTKPTINGSTQGVVAATDGATVTFDLSASNMQTVTIAGNRTLALSNVSIGQVFSIRIQQDATGSRTVSWFSGIKRAGGTAPTLTTTASKADRFIFVCTGSGTYDGAVAMSNL